MPYLLTLTLILTPNGPHIRPRQRTKFPPVTHFPKLKQGRPFEHTLGCAFRPCGTCANLWRTKPPSPVSLHGKAGAPGRLLTGDVHGSALPSREALLGDTAALPWAPSMSWPAMSLLDPFRGRALCFRPCGIAPHHCLQSATQVAMFTRGCTGIRLTPSETPHWGGSGLVF